MQKDFAPTANAKRGKGPRTKHQARLRRMRAQAQAEAERRRRWPTRKERFADNREDDS